MNDPEYSGDIDFSKIVTKGTEEYRNGNADSLSGIETPDSPTITIRTEKQNPLTLQTLGGEVISKAYYGEDYKKWQLDHLRAL